MASNDQKLALLRQDLQQQGVDSFLIPSQDEFNGEYVPDYARRLEWITGISVSNGCLLVTQTKAIFFTDSRYSLMASEQLSDSYQVVNLAQKSIASWITENMQEKQIIALDPWLHNKTFVESLRGICDIQFVEQNLVDQLWLDKPAKPQDKIIIHSLCYAGVTADDKKQQLQIWLKKNNIDVLLITAPDSLCWLLNIRGNDVNYTPLVLSFALFYQDGVIDLFIDDQRVDAETKAYLGAGVHIYPETTLAARLLELEDKTIQIDGSTSAYYFFQQMASFRIIDAVDPTLLMKAIKNPTEILGAEQAHLQDGVAMVKFLHWFEGATASCALTEISIAEKLLSFRQESADFVYPSFGTIAGFAKNGAIIHYQATEQTNQVIQGDGLLLVDSGGQYPFGTTDITRTIAVGTPSCKQKNNFTNVLKGHIALADAHFPAGTTGSKLDILARYFLWQTGLDYEHGTGHGVGSYLSVHEGPQRISPRENNVAFKAGMIVSNEPGYYKAGHYGIRIESLLITEQDKLHENFLKFRTLTLVPIDLRLIDLQLLTMTEKSWLNNYHLLIWQTLSPLITSLEVLAWLQNATVKI